MRQNENTVQRPAHIEAIQAAHGPAPLQQERKRGLGEDNRLQGGAALGGRVGRGEGVLLLPLQRSNLFLELSLIQLQLHLQHNQNIHNMTYVYMYIL